MEDLEPIKTFDKDLLQVVDDFVQAGFRIIVMGDMNQRMGTSITGLEKKLKERGIIDHTRERYGREEAPNTQRRGSAPIDAIFGSTTLKLIRGGYGAGEPGISNHRCIWGEFTLDSMLGVD